MHPDAYCIVHNTPDAIFWIVFGTFCDDIQYFQTFRFEISNIKTLFHVDFVIQFMELIRFYWHLDLLQISVLMCGIFRPCCLSLLSIKSINNKGNDYYSSLKNVFLKDCLGISARWK